MKLHLDYETRSECDLKLSGAYVYARHPSTRILCAAYSIDGGPICCWPALVHPRPADLLAALDNPRCEIHAWNAQFERLITKHVLGIDVPLQRYQCSAMLARARGLPGKLVDALEFLGVEQSVEAKRRGNRIMLKWCKPLPAGGWASDPAEYMELLRYCVADVDSEMLIEARLHPLFGWEREEYLLAETINDRGLPVDRTLALAAAGLGVLEKVAMNKVIAERTGDAITSVSQHARIKAWLKEQLDPEVFRQFFVKKVRGKDTMWNEEPNEFKETTDSKARVDFLDSEYAKEAAGDLPDVIEVLELVESAGKSSVAKYARMHARSDNPGQRAEGAYICFGAIQTKRYSSTGIQMHNLPRQSPDDVPDAIARVFANDFPAEDRQVLGLLASLLRSTIKAPPGRSLVWGDWSAVEARGMPWMADCQWKLDLYRNGVDVYRKNAHDIFGTAYEDVDEDERQTGKVAELSLQFGGAKGALRAMARSYRIQLTEDRAEAIVRRWRKANAWAAEFSKGLFEAFLRTVLGTDSAHGPVAYRQIISLIPGTVSLACDLPGGTTLYYHGIQGTIELWQRPTEQRLTIYQDMPGWDGRVLSHWGSEVMYTKTLPGGVGRPERIWHGLLAENVTQALCAALLRDCLRRVNAGLKKARLDAFVIGHTHDEILLESSADHEARACNVLRREMVTVPEWLTGFPLGCEVKSGPRYVK